MPAAVTTAHCQPQTQQGEQATFCAAFCAPWLAAAPHTSSLQGLLWGQHPQQPEKRLSKGLAELCWAFPSGKDTRVNHRVFATCEVITKVSLAHVRCYNFGVTS